MGQICLKIIHIWYDHVQILLQGLIVVQQWQCLFGSYGCCVYDQAGPAKQQIYQTIISMEGLICKHEHVILFSRVWSKLN